MSSIELRHVTKRFGNASAVLDDVSLEIAEGELVVLVGPSGCGKSTLLRIIAGLDDPTEGEVFLDDERVTEKAPRERNLAMVFQSYALYPHLSVFENIAFPLRLSGRRREEEIRRKVEEKAKMLQLEELLGRKPGQLSGGQRQRVAMGRVMVRDARAFLFDEPLSNLDARLRGQMRIEISRLQRRLGVTTVYVTHDQTEAMTLGDRVAVLLRGRLWQVASPREIYRQPANLFVAGFIGSPPMNVVPAKVDGGVVTLPFAQYELPEEAARRVGGRRTVHAGIRPECIEEASRARARRERGVSFRAGIDVIEWLGDVQYAYAPYEVQDPERRSRTREILRELDLEALRSQLTVSLDPESDLREGAEAELWFDPARVHLFDDLEFPFENLMLVDREGPLGQRHP